MVILVQNIQVVAVGVEARAVVVMGIVVANDQIGGVFELGAAAI